MSSLLLATEDAEQEEAEALTILRPESTYNTLRQERSNTEAL